MKRLKNLTKWQNYAHYALLALIVSWVAARYGAPIDFPMFMVLFVTLVVADTAIHLLFASLPGKYKWSD